MAETTLSPASSHVPMGRLLRMGLVALVASVVANLIVRALLLAVLDISPAFPPFQVGAIAFFTALGAIGATLVFALISRFAARPVRTFQIVALVVLILSIIPNIAAALNPASAPFPFPGVTATAMLALMLLHLVAAAVIVPLLSRAAD